MTTHNRSTLAGERRMRGHIHPNFHSPEEEAPQADDLKQLKKADTA